MWPVCLARRRIYAPKELLGNDLQVDARVAMLTLLARVQWLQGFPDQADATVREAIDAALRMHHWFSICYVLFFAGGPVSLWTGDLA